MAFYFTKMIRPTDHLVSEICKDLDFETVAAALWRLLDYVQDLGYKADEILAWSIEDVKRVLKLKRQKAERVWAAVRPYVSQILKEISPKEWTGSKTPSKRPAAPKENSTQLMINDFLTRMNANRGKKQPKKSATPKPTPAPATALPRPSVPLRVQHGQVQRPWTPGAGCRHVSGDTCYVMGRPFPLAEAVATFHQRSQAALSRLPYCLTTHEMDEAFGHWCDFGVLPADLLEAV